MAHREEQILDRIVVLHEAITIAQTFKHRVLSLAESQDELPAYSVTNAQDDPQTDNMGFIESLVTVRVWLFAVNPDEVALRTFLAQMRSESHRVMQADKASSGQPLGLAFVTDVRYGGAAEPQIIATNQFAGARATLWQVLYRMNETDPE